MDRKRRIALEQKLQAQGFDISMLPWPRKITYYNPEGEAMRLPADPYSMEHYLNKGYSLKPLTSQEPQEREAFVCDVCGKAFSSRIALTGHKRSHK